MKTIPFFVLILLFFSGCTTSPKVDIAAEAEALRNLENQITVAFQNRDIEKLMSFGAYDIVQMAPDTPKAIGIEAYGKRLAAMFADTVYLWESYSLNVEFVEVSSSGDLAYVRGTDLLKNKTPEGIGDDPAKWVDIWKKIDGQWKLVVNIWNR